MKILILTSSLPVNDSDKVPGFVRDQAVSLKKQFPDVQIHLVAPHSKTSNTTGFKKCNTYYREYRFHYFAPRYESLVGAGILPSIRQNYLRIGQVPFFVLFEIISLLKLSRKLKPDIIYAHWFTPQAISAWIASRLLHIPMGFTTHSSDMQVLKKVPFGIRLATKICKDSRFITIVSNQTLEKTRMLFSKNDWSQFSSKISILPMGVNINKINITNPKRDKKYAIELFRLNPKNKHLLFMGRLVEIKGVDTLLHAFAKMERKDVSLIIAGDGQDKETYTKTAKRLEIEDLVHFVGFVNGAKKDALFAVADAVCLPSIVDSSGHTEGLPVVFMEAIAHKKIVVASNVSGAQHVITNGVDGFIYQHESPSKLANTLEKALRLTQDQKYKVESRAYSTAQQFSWNNINKKFMNRINSVLEPPK